MTTAEIELQKRRFQEALDEVFTEKYNHKVEFNDDGLVVEAQVNTNETLDKAQLDHLSFMGDSWRLDLQISRSGAGLKIKFKLKED